MKSQATPSLDLGENIISIYWEGNVPYCAFGMGARSFIDISAGFTRPRSIKAYANYVDLMRAEINHEAEGGLESSSVELAKSVAMEKLRTDQ